jgi:hypothetical protein
LPSWHRRRNAAIIKQALSARYCSMFFYLNRAIDLSRRGFRTEFAFNRTRLMISQSTRRRLSGAHSSLEPIQC